MTLRKWAAGIAAIVLLAVAAAPALATTYYVNPTPTSRANEARRQAEIVARDSRAGTAEATAWGSLDKASATVASGDVIILLPGQYNGDSLFNPTCQLEATDWVTYIGSLTDPGSVRIAGDVTLSRPYVSIKGVAFQRELTLASNRDSLQYCSVAGNVTWGAADYCYVGNNHFNGYAFSADKKHVIATSPYGWELGGFFTRGNTFTGNHFTNLYGSPTSGHGNSFSMVGIDSCDFLFNTFDINGSLAGSPSYYCAVKHATYLNFRGNRWNYSGVQYGGESPDYAVGLVFRDSVQYVSMDRDTFLTTDAQKVKLEISASGNFPSTVHNITIDSCYINTGDWVWAQNQANALTVTRNIIINENGAALSLTDGMKERVIIDHNTLIGKMPDGYGAQYIFGITNEGAPWADTVSVTNNIFYALGQTSELPDPLDPALRDASAAYYGATAQSDTALFRTYNEDAPSHSNMLVADHNLYSYYGSAYSQRMGTWCADTIGTRSVRLSAPEFNVFGWPGGHNVLRESVLDSVSIVAGVFADSVSVVAGLFADSVIIHFHPTLNDTTFTAYVGREVVTPPSSGKLGVARTVKTAPTSGRVAAASSIGPPITSGPWDRWCDACDDSSKYGSPMFADSIDGSSWEDLNPNLTRYSLARGLADDGGDVGALTYTSPPVLGMVDNGVRFEFGASAQADSATVLFVNRGDADSLFISGLEVVDPDGEGVGEFVLSSTTARLASDKTATLQINFTPTPTLSRGAPSNPLRRIASVYIAGTCNDPIDPVVYIPMVLSERSE
jgi:hypothetical protein